MKNKPNSIEWRKKYEKHIKSQKWRNIRDSMFKLRGKKCESCGESSYALEVHHLTYERMGNESPKDLMVLCKECHKKEDNKRKHNSFVKRRNARINKAFMTWCLNSEAEPDGHEWERFCDWFENVNGGY
jgi:5-methylcytosine-specific restriction endonuclease McrA